MTNSNISLLDEQSKSKALNDRAWEAELEDDSFNLNPSWLFDVIWGGRWILLGCVILALALGLAATLLSTPVFQASSSIHLQQDSGERVGVPGSEGGARTDFSRFAQTQIDLIKSRATAREVFNQGKLGSDSLFRKVSGIEAYGSGRPDAATAQKIENRAVSYLRRTIAVKLTNGTEIVQVSAETSSPGLSTRIANAYARAAAKLDLQRQFDSSSYSRAFLAQQLGVTRERLEAAELALNNYARDTGIVATGTAADGSQQPTVTVSSLGQVSIGTNDAATLRLQAEQVWRVAERAPLMSIPQVAADPLVQQLQQQSSQAKVKLEQDRITLGPDHPTVRQDQANVTALGTAVTGAARQVLRQIRQQYETAKQQETAMLDRVRGLKEAAIAEGRAGVRYAFLKRDVDTNRVLYEALLQRQKELSAIAGLGKSNLTVIDEAVAPGSPISPNLMVNLAISLMAGIFLGIAIVLMRTQMDQRLRSPEEVSQAAALPLLGVIPMVESGAPIREELERPRSPIAEAYFSARASLALARGTGLPQTILVTSSDESEGKSTTAFALALSVALLGKRSLIVDGDLRRPSLHRIIDVPNRVGFVNYLASNASLADVVQPTHVPQLFVVTAGSLPPSPTELLSSATLDAFINEARREFDFIAIDSPPVLGLADALLLSARVDGVVFATESSRTTKSIIRKALARLRSVNAPLLGIVLTKHVARGNDGYYNRYYNYDSRPDVNGEA